MFGKKKKDGRPVPTEEIRSMARQGMSDKDIIKELKHKGYSYDEIERAMLSAVKEGVDDSPIQRRSTEFDSFTSPAEDVFSAPSMQTDFELPTLAEDEGGIGEDTTGVIEELIEGVIEEKWGKFEDRFTKIEDAFDRIRSEIKQFELKMEQQKIESPTKDLEAKISDLADQMDELDARVGGLEKAFKQFLPALTRNVESLSHLIHDLREKQGQPELEEEV